MAAAIISIAVIICRTDPAASRTYPSAVRTIDISSTVVVFNHCFVDFPRTYRVVVFITDNGTVDIDDFSRVDIFDGTRFGTGIHNALSRVDDYFITIR